MTPREELTNKLVEDYRQELAALTDAELYSQAVVMAKMKALDDNEWANLLRKFKEMMK